MSFPDRAFQLLNDLGLHLPDDFPRDARSKFAIKTSDSNNIGPGKKYTRWTRLFQCLCGSNNEVGHHASKKRYTAWENVKCSMFSKVISTHDEQNAHGRLVSPCFDLSHCVLFQDKKLLIIDEISGMLDHSPACQEHIVMSRKPTIPLHPELREHALSLLRDLVPIGRIRLLCRSWAKARWGESAGNTQYRFVLAEYESTSLYRTLRHEEGIPERSKAIDNIEEWFRPTNHRPPSPLFTQSCLYYQPLGPGNLERLVLILSTPRQQEMAWKYGHKSQMLMDGTFGVCSTSVLVFFLMVVDDCNTGVPVATILFTPKKDAKAGHASYDGPLIRDLLEQWKAGMGKNEDGETFEICVGNTDNDTRERFALAEIWPNITLLLCMFHTWQAWRNGLTRYLGCVPKGKARQEVRSRLGKFLMHLLKDITDYPTAISAYNLELAFFRTLGHKRNSQLDQKKSKGGLAFLAYLKTYLNVRSFWMSWSKAGVLEAARTLNIPVKDIPRTNNHLESFNGRAKKKYLAAYEHSGRLPRLDAWIMIILTRVMVDFFDEYDERRMLSEYYELMRYAPRSPRSPTLNLPDAPAPITIIPANASAIVTDLNDDVEKSFIQQLVDDGDDELEVNSTDEDDAPLEGFGLSLVVDEDGEGSSMSITSESDSFEGSRSATPSDFDVALDESLIICDLPSDTDLPFPFLLGQSSPSNSDHMHHSFNLDSLDIDGLVFPLNHDATSAKTHSSAEATAYQEIILAEDLLAERLTHFLSISKDANSHNIVTPHISPHLRLQLPQWTPTDTPALSPSTSPILRTSISLPVSLPLVDHNPQTDLFVGLLPQKKERRKQSYGIR
jgi:hypothetical protein